MTASRTGAASGRTLRRMLLVVALLTSSAAAAAMLGAVSLVKSLRENVERDTEVFMEEQRMADRIVVLTNEQQLAAYRELERPGTVNTALFSARGDSAYREMRRYLFHELSLEARLQVESIKEAHQLFEVAANRSFDLSNAGRTDEARKRLSSLDARAEALDSAVSKFRAARERQRNEFRASHAVLAQRLDRALLLVAGALVLLGIVVAVTLLRRVLRPLDHLATMAGRIAEGDTLARVPPQNYREFDVVANGFNHMAGRVQAARDEVVAQNLELHQALEHLRATQEDLVQHEKLSAMGQMLAGLAHELNNPLAGILGMAEVLQDELARAPERDTRELGTEFAEPLVREAVRANALVRSLLQFARKPGDVLESVPLGATLSTAVGLRAHAFAQQGKTVRVDIPTDLCVIAEAQKLQQVAVNLINNALDALVTGGGTGLVISATHDGGEFVLVEFHDDGPGIPDIALAFTPFHTTKAAGKGTGLGLGLVTRFVKEFGGTVNAHNVTPRGACITVRLLVAPEPPSESRNESEEDN
ncbi:MAG: ATP-binding protein [Gemmatimonadota bacterium]